MTREGETVIAAALRRFAMRPAADVRLFCFPHAGGAASGFRSWAPLLPVGIDLYGAQYPGREDRLVDKQATEMATLVAELADAVEGLLDRPYAFFGHSMGAAVAFEVALELRRRGRPEPTRLFVSAHESPDRLKGGTIHLRDDAELVTELARLNASAATALADPDLAELMVPIIRTDYQLIETYRPTDSEPLRCPITVLRGESDPDVTAADAAGWESATTASCSQTAFPGGHFYLVDVREAVVATVAGWLSQDTGISAGTASHSPGGSYIIDAP